LQALRQPSVNKDEVLVVAQWTNQTDLAGFSSLAERGLAFERDASLLADDCKYFAVCASCVATKPPDPPKPPETPKPCVEIKIQENTGLAGRTAAGDVFLNGKQVCSIYVSCPLDSKGCGTGRTVECGQDRVEWIPTPSEHKTIWYWPRGASTSIAVGLEYYTRPLTESSCCEYTLACSA